MRSAGRSEDVEEAGAEEIAALAGLLVRRPHIPTQRGDGDGDGDGDDTAAAVVPEAPDPTADHIAVLPRQRNEFVCPRCFLVVHMSQRAGDVCRDCC